MRVVGAFLLGALLIAPSATTPRLFQADPGVTNNGTSIGSTDRKDWTIEGSTNGNSNPTYYSQLTPAELEALRKAQIAEWIRTTPAICQREAGISPALCGTPRNPEDPTEDAPVYPTYLSASDLAIFTPNAPSVTGEPEHAGLIGQPTNIVGAATEHVQTGELFGFPVLAVFTPSSYTFDYGDGTIENSGTGGTTWASTNQPQFADAPTAHAYSNRGVYTATVTVHYTAAVAFPNGIWINVDGTVRASSSYDVQIYKAVTALVNETCIENPSGPGC